jgi:hypothetical protein
LTEEAAVKIKEYRKHKQWAKGRETVLLDAEVKVDNKDVLRCTDVPLLVVVFTWPPETTDVADDETESKVDFSVDDPVTVAVIDDDV